MSVTAYIAMGSNLGVRWKNLELAVEKLRATPGIDVLKVSSWLDNPSVGGPDDAPRFLNGAVEISTTLSPRELLQVLMQIEASMGRVRSMENAPRVIDLDILLYGNQIISEPDLEIPHPRMHERAFVLQPMEEIARDLKHPMLKQTMHELLESLAR